MWEVAARRVADSLGNAVLSWLELLIGRHLKHDDRGTCVSVLVILVSGEQPFPLLAPSAPWDAEVLALNSVQCT